MNPKPEEVFVPGKFPIHQHNIYASRGQPEDDLNTSLERGFVPLIFGSYGVGKSSLAMHCAEPWRENNKLVYVQSAYQKTLSDVFERVLEHVGYEVTVEKSSSSESTVEGQVSSSISAGLFETLKAKLKSRVSSSESSAAQEVKQLAVKSPSDARILDICEEHDILLVIDELHRATDLFKQNLSAFIKAYINNNCKNFKICLLGTENDASELVISDPGVGRTLEEILVEPMSNREAIKIIEPGMRKLNINIEREITNRIVKSGVGSPFIIQYLCLEMSEKALEESSTDIKKEYFDYALGLYARRKAQRSIRKYKGAIETFGPKRYRKQILHAMAKSKDEYVTMDFLVKQVSKQLGEDVPNTALSGPLRDLKSTKYGEILRDVENISGSSRVYNYSAFSDPGMKSIIRMIQQIQIDELADE